MINNERRARKAFRSVKGYAGTGELLKTHVIDFLADLRHLCAAKGIDFDDAARTARSHFGVEANAKETSSKR